MLSYVTFHCRNIHIAFICLRTRAFERSWTCDDAGYPIWVWLRSSRNDITDISLRQLNTSKNQFFDGSIISWLVSSSYVSYSFVLWSIRLNTVDRFLFQVVVNLKYILMNVRGYVHLCAHRISIAWYYHCCILRNTRFHGVTLTCILLIIIFNSRERNGYLPIDFNIVFCFHFTPIRVRSYLEIILARRFIIFWL